MVDVRDLIRQGEGVALEYKREVSSPYKIAKLLVAFSNNRGGKILIGVDDYGKICGVRDSMLQKMLLLSAAKEFCDPPVSPSIETLSHNGKKILLATIRESNCKPHWWVSAKGEKQIYIRVKDKNAAASIPIIKDIQMQMKVRVKSSDLSEKKESFVVAYLKEHEKITLKEFCGLVNISKRRALRILVSLRKRGKIYLHTTGRQEFYTLA